MPPHTPPNTPPQSPNPKDEPVDRVPFDAASTAIGARLARLGPRTTIVGVTGPQGSGKTTLAQRLAHELAPGRAIVLSTDRYLPDYSTIPASEVDEPRHARLDRLASDLGELHRGQAASVPVWSFHTHRPEGEEAIGPAGLIIVEGIFALHEAVRGALDLGVFVEAPISVRWQRVESRELAGERGWGVERSREHFETVADPIFGRYEAAYRAVADVIVVND